MRIAYVTCVYPPYPGGIGVLAQGMAHEMSRRGYSVAVFTPTPRRAIQIEDPKAGLRSAGGPFPASQAAVEPRYLDPAIRYGNAALLPRLLRTLQGFEIIHFLYPFFGAAEFLPLLRRRTKAKIVLHHTMDAVEEGFLGALFRIYNQTLMPIIFKQAHTLLTLSDDYFRECDVTDVYANFPDAPPIEFVPNGVDTDLFRPRVAKEIPNPQFPIPTILFASGLDRAHYFKGLHVLIEAMKILEQRKIECRAWIIGDGRMRAEYEKHAQEVGLLSTHIEFLGLVSHEKMPDYYQASTVAVVPSTARVECFSIVAAEAQACGIPAIVSDFPGVRVTIADGKSGYVVRPGDPEDLADKLALILRDRIQSKKMGEAGRVRAEQLYSWKVIGNQLQTIYENLCH